MNRIQRTTLFILFCVASLQAIAAQTEDINYASISDSILETVVVTGTRTEHSFIKAPVKVEVINKADLQNQHAFDLSEGLKTLPGVQLKSVTGKEGQEAWIQGISANRVLVLIDGEPVSASTGSAVDLSQIAASDVERIEVVKGAASVLYGSQAMGGVINVITGQAEQGLHGRIAIDGGSYGNRNTSANASDISRTRIAAQLSYANESFYLKGNLNQRYSDGFKTDPALWRQEGPDGHRNSASILAGFTPSDSQLYTVRYENYDQALHSQLFTGNNLDEKIDNAKRDRLSLKADWSSSDSRIIVKGFHEEYDTDSMPSKAKSRYSEMPMSQLDSQWTIDLNDNFAITSGALLFQESFYQTSTDRTSGTKPEVDDEQRNNQELFSQIESKLSSWTFVPGVRIQNDSDFGTHISPKLSMRVDANESFFIRASIGDGYRVSNLKERYYVFDHTHIGYIIIGNPDLEPEQSLSQQLSFVVTDYNRYQAELSFFRNDLDNLIETSAASRTNNITTYQYKNISEALTQGVELSGSYQITNDFKVQGGYTFLDSKNINRGHQLNDRPEHQVKLSLNYLTPWLMDINIIASWQSEAYQYDYDVNGDFLTKWETSAWSQIDLKLSQAIYQTDRQSFNIYGGIDNINDEIKNFNSPFDNRPEVGRVVYLGASIEF